MNVEEFEKILKASHGEEPDLYTRTFASPTAVLAEHWVKEHKPGRTYRVSDQTGVFVSDGNDTYSGTLLYPYKHGGWTMKYVHAAQVHAILR